MLKRIKRSISYRLPWVYKRILARLPIKRFPQTEQSDKHLLTMCGERHLPMLVECLFSAACYWDAIPNMTVYSDGTCQPEDISASLSWWPGNINIGDMAVALEWADSNGFQQLKKYAEKDGFGKKLLVIAKESSVGRVVWFDTDMLFVDDIAKLLNKTKAESSGLFAATDWCEGYDQSLVGTNQSLNHLKTLPLVNTGFVDAASPLYDDTLEPLIQHALPTCNGFTEQTVLAKIVYDTGRIAWDFSDIDISDGDRFDLIPNSSNEGPFAIRHYVTPIRHLFWRDAFYNRLLLRKQDQPY